MAAQALAFSHAAHLYQRALAVTPVSRQYALHSQLGHALAHAGRSGDAGEAFLAAAAGAPEERSLELRRLATHYLLRGGRVARGLAVARELLHLLGISLPTTRSGMVASAVWQRLRLRARGLNFEARLPAGTQAHESAVCDFLWSIASAIGYVDVVLGADLHTRALRRALELGDPLRIARSLALEGMHGVEGDAVKTRGVIATAESIAQRHDDHFSIAYAMLASSTNRVHNADPARALKEADQAALLFEQHCRDVAWEISFARIVGLAAAVHLGRFRDMESRFQLALREAEERGNLFGVSTIVGLYAAPLAIAADQPEKWRPRIQHAMSRWPIVDSHQQHFA